MVYEIQYGWLFVGSVGISECKKQALKLKVKRERERGKKTHKFGYKIVAQKKTEIDARGRAQVGLKWGEF